MASPHQTRTAAIELTLHRLQHPNQPETYEDSIHGTIARLCPTGVQDLTALVIHLADCMAAVLIKDCDSREAAIASLQQQLTDAIPAGSAK